MLLSLLFLTLSFIFGLSVASLIPIRWHKTEYLAVGLTMGIFLGTWTTFLFTWLMGYEKGFGTSLLCMTAVSLIAWHFTNLKYSWRNSFWFEKKSDFYAWLTVGVASVLLFGFLLHTHMLLEKNGAYYSGGSTWGDLALHLALVTRFANQTHFTWDFPIFFGSNLAYPFLTDFTSGLLYRFGFSLQTALIVPVFAYLVCFIQFLWFFSWRWFKKGWAASLTIFLVLSNGGPKGLILFWHDWQASNLSLVSFLGNMTKEYAHIIEHGVIFSNIVVDYVLPQRGFVGGVALFCLLLILISEAWKKHDSSPILFTFIAGLGGLLPFLHVHTFFVLAGIMVWLTVGDMLKTKTIATPWLTCLLAMCTLAAPQVAWQVSSNYTPNFGYIHFGWMKDPDEFWLTFWLANLGLAVVFLVANFWFIARIKKIRDFWWLLFGALTTLFIMTNVYIFQPNPYDNMKFMIFSYMGIVIITAPWLYRWLQQSIPLRIVAVVCIISLTLTGMLSILRESYTSWIFLSEEDIAIADQIKKIVGPDDRLLTGSAHNNPVPTLTGRRIVMGYPGWLWTYGLNYQPTDADVSAMFQGLPSTPSLLKKYQVHYVLIGASERAERSANDTYFAGRSHLVGQTKHYNLYDVRDLQ